MATQVKLLGGCFCTPNKPTEFCDVPSPDAVPISLTDEQELASVWPTWKVFAYWDTGKRENVNGKEIKKLQPMYPFGMYLDHEGKYYGFKSALAGVKDVVVTQLNDVQYLLKIQNEGKAKLGVSLAAQEEPVKPGPVGGGIIPQPKAWWQCLCSAPARASDSAAASVTGVLSLLGLAWVARRRRRMNN